MKNADISCEFLPLVLLFNMFFQNSLNTSFFLSTFSMRPIDDMVFRLIGVSPVLI